MPRACFQNSYPDLQAKSDESQAVILKKISEEDKLKESESEVNNCSKNFDSKAQSRACFQNKGLDSSAILQGEQATILSKYPAIQKEFCEADLAKEPRSKSNESFSNFSLKTGSSELSIFVLAAGKGTRMKSDLPKVMHKIAGREMLNLVIDQSKILSPKLLQITISEELQSHIDEIKKNHPKIILNFALQIERKGTAHALSCAIEALKNQSKNYQDDKNFLGEKVLVLYGDTPLLTAQTMQKMLNQLDYSRLCILAFEENLPNNYGRLVVDEKGNLQKIVEYKDANQEEKNIRLCNSGVIAIRGEHLQSWLGQIKDENAAGEFYLTDLVAIANLDKNCSFGQATFIQTNQEEVLGVNSRQELAAVESIWQRNFRKKLMLDGTTIIAPETAFFSFDSKIGRDVIIHPNVVFGSKVEIADNVEIKSFCHIEGAKIASGSVIGPFARIRPKTEIGADCRIGNFVEVKNSKIAQGAKANHLSYLGDCEIDESSNIGAGTITCNYDGFEKHKSKIGKNVFIGSNSALVAPVEIADGAMIGAGSVITKNVEKDDLAIARSKQFVIAEGAKKFRQKFFARLNPKNLKNWE